MHVSFLFLSRFFSKITQGGATFTFYSPPATLSFAPDRIRIGQSDTNNTVTINGCGLIQTHEYATCRFAGNGNASSAVIFTPATYISRSEILCAAPVVLNPQSFTLEICLNGIDCSNNGNIFVFVGLPSMLLLFNKEGVALDPTSADLRLLSDAEVRYSFFFFFVT